MALIHCPECNKEISDQCNKCIHCGYPIQKQNTIIINNQQYNAEPIYQAIIQYQNNQLDRNHYIGIICRTLASYKCLSYEYINKLTDIIAESQSIPGSFNGQTMEEWKEEESKPHCPKCNSTSIQMVPRKWSFFAGFATNKVDRVCANCKHKW